MKPEEKAAAFDRLCEMLLVPPGFPAVAAYAEVEKLVDERNDARSARAELELELLGRVRGAGGRPVSSAQGRLVFTDLETMGLDNRSPIVEVAMVLTTSDLEIVDQKTEVVTWDRRDWETASAFARAMHEKSGLRAESEAGAADGCLWMVERRFKEWLEGHGFKPGDTVIAGNSIGQDRIWIASQMSSLHTFLHHRMVDVSAVRQLIQRWVQPSYGGPPGDDAAHRALSDALWSRRELGVYRHALFVGNEDRIIDRLTEPGR